jgi:uncharacterized LabA/DUF88 family protein
MNDTGIKSAEDARGISRVMDQLVIDQENKEQEEQNIILNQLQHSGNDIQMSELIQDNIEKAAQLSQSSIEVRFPDTFQVGELTRYQTIEVWYHGFLKDHLSSNGYKPRLSGEAIGYEDILLLTW